MASCAASLRGGVVTSLLRVWLSETRGQVLLTGWVVTFVGITGRAVYMRTQLKAQRALKAPEPAVVVAEPPPKKKKAPPGPIRTILRLAMPSYRSKATVWFAVFTIGLGVRLAISVKVSSEVGVLGSLLAKREWPELFQRMLTYALWAVPAAGTAALQKFSREKAALCLRDELMHSVHAKLGAAGADAPEGGGNRGAAPARTLPLAVASAAGAAADASRGGAVDVFVSDPRTFCTTAVELYEALSKPLIEVSLLSIKLASMMGPAQLVQCYAFFAAAGCWTRFAGPSIATMTTTVSEAEAELLGQHTHLAEYAEEVAMIGGGAAEANAMQSALAVLTSRTARLQLQRLGSDTCDGYVLRHLGILAAFTAMLPAVISAAPASGIDPTEYFLTSLHLLVNVGMACKDLVLSHKTAAAASAHAKRIQALLHALEAQPPAATGPPPRALLRRSLRPSDACVLELKDLTVALPSSAAAPLVGPLTLSVPRGARVLVSGPNGCGKSSLLRALLGVWPVGSGSVYTPPASEVFVLPQRAYLLSTGSVKAQVRLINSQICMSISISIHLYL